jgi:DNA-binding transcriptional LysR family regulator
MGCHALPQRVAKCHSVARGILTPMTLNKKLTAPLDWDDLRHLLAVADGGNLVEAGRILSVNHSTVLRRLAALEERLGGALFLRQGRYVPTRLGESALTAARAMADEAERLEQRLAMGLQPLQGEIVIETRLGFVERAIMPFIAEFLDTHPGISIGTFSGQPGQSTRGAVILGMGDPPVRWHVQEVRQLTWSAYTSKQYRDGLRNEDRVEAPWIDYAESAELRRVRVWLARQLGGQSARLAVDSLEAAACAALSGMGVAVLPLPVAKEFPLLVPVSEPIANLAGSLWIACEPAAAKTPRVETLVAFIASRIAADSAWGSA